MTRATPYLFCRYSILDEDDPITPDEEWSLLNEINGQTISYRVREPNPDDFDTFLMRPRRRQYAGHVFAVDDTISDRTLGAKSAVSRFIEIVQQNVAESEVQVNFAGTPDDAQRALDTWTLDQFSFTVRPFNPTPRKMGEQIHELMIPDNVGKLTAIATPREGEEMKDSHHGLIAEAKGLTEAGYGQYGATGTTPDGLRASLSKPKFTMDKEKNKQAQAQNRTLKVYIPKGNNSEEDEVAIIKALLDLYGE